ncbi:DUF485 domain-containing protein [Yinghuangia seranimata]|uniref:DUF485 domain-containing protein n=1 Tax=Yinghuangia seranimata TaxID=408067 RepID=UPI00248D2E13|nr:DUF485 domain-containing protein [Yinghuangia seranimata]MDI2125858.1 DUF485 domain-containing protein [Yinghuangia seranimata]
MTANPSAAQTAVNAAAAASRAAEAASGTPAAVLHADPRFRELKHRFRWFVFPVTAIFLAWYLLYVLLCAYARDFMAHKVVGNVNVALVFGLGQFAATFLTAWVYSRYAARRLDPLSAELRAEAAK